MIRTYFVPALVSMCGGCFGGVISDGITGDPIDGATVTVQNCPTCPVHSTTTNQWGVFQFNGYAGDPLIGQWPGARAVKITVSKSGYLTRTVFHRVEYEVVQDGADELLVALAGVDLYAGAATDSDSDGVPDVQEAAVGTDPAARDTDLDGITDGWEVNGHAWVDYVKHGCDPLHKDLLIEVDYERFVSPSMLWTARLSASVIAKIEQLFAATSHTNPDGTTGIAVHIVLDNTLPDGFDCTNEYETTSHFEPLHRAAFRYAALCVFHTPSQQQGAAEIGGQRFYVRHHGAHSEDAEDLDHLPKFLWYAKFVHELGHTLGLRHGGDEDANCKPNYPSLMNYAYKESFNDSPKTLAGTQIRFSPGRFAGYDLDETDLNELYPFPGATVADLSFLQHYPGPGGFSGSPGFDLYPWAIGCNTGVSVDWDRNGIINASSANINSSSKCNGSASTLHHDFDDFGAIEIGLRLNIPAHCYPYICAVLPPIELTLPHDAASLKFLLSMPRHGGPSAPCDY